MGKPISVNNGNCGSKEWAIRILLTLSALSIGFGISQLALAGQVVKNTTNIDTMKASLSRMETKLDTALGIR